MSKWTNHDTENDSLLPGEVQELPAGQMGVGSIAESLVRYGYDSDSEAGGRSLRRGRPGVVVIVCGGGENIPKERVFRVLTNLHTGSPIRELHIGSSPGTDNHAFEWALENRIKACVYPIDWSRMITRAWQPRNERMLKESNADYVVAFPGSAKTTHMVAISRQAGLQILDDLL